MQKRTLLTALALAPLLGACGFRLRGVPEFAFRSLYLSAPAASPLARELQRTLASAGAALTVSRDPQQLTQAEVILDLQSEQHERVVVAYNSSGLVRELQLRLRVSFRLRTLAGEELIGNTELLQTRDVSYNETQALAKEAEEALLFRNMQTDVVQQLLRRLAAVQRD